MSKRSANSGGNPFKVLYWMAAGVLVLLVGVIALIMLKKPVPRVNADPERTMVWLYDSGSKSGPAYVTLIEESRSKGSLAAVSFLAPDIARSAYGDKGAKRTQEQVAQYVNRKVHHRVFLPFSVVATLIDAAGGVELGGKALSGADAVAYIKQGGEQEAGRGIAVMLALSSAMSQRGINMGVSQGLSLAREVETDLDLVSIPDVLGRWSHYTAPELKVPATADAAAIQTLLQPDPAPPADQ